MTDEIIEVCICGHIKSQHNPRVYGKDTPLEIQIEGHGDCKLCGCDKFSWHENLRQPLTLSGTRLQERDVYHNEVHKINR